MTTEVAQVRTDDLFNVNTTTSVQVNQRELDGDWFQSIRDKLNWNLRTLQSPYHEHLSSDLVAEQSKHRSSSRSPQQQPQFFTLPTSRATERDGSSGPPKGDSTRGSPI